MRGGLPLALALLVLLGGCVQQPRVEPPDWTAHREAVSARGVWDLQGKIGLRSPGRAGSAFLSWNQQSDNYRLVLSGALGLGRLVLEGDASGVSWQGKDGKRRHHPDPAAMIAEAWGWTVPVNALRFWIRGIPDPSLPVEDQVLHEGLATRFRQSGWIVMPQNYSDASGLRLPSRVRLEHDAAALTVSISRWTFPPA
jgi:outer membrane lipoprotein LolB